MMKRSYSPIIGSLIDIYPFLCSACFLRLRSKRTTTKMRIKRNTPHATPTAIQISAETEEKNNAFDYHQTTKPPIDGVVSVENNKLNYY